MQRVADDANMDLEIFIYRPEENIGPFLENFHTLNDALTEVSKIPGNINKFTPGFDEVIVFGIDNLEVSRTSVFLHL